MSTLNPVFIEPSGHRAPVSVRRDGWVFAHTFDGKRLIGHIDLYGTNWVALDARGYRTGERFNLRCDAVQWVVDHPWEES